MSASRVRDAVRILLTRTAREGGLPYELTHDAAHDAWFRPKVIEALADSRPAVLQDEICKAIRDAIEILDDPFLGI